MTGLLCWGMLGASAWAGGRPTVTGVRAASHDGITRFVVDLSEPVDYHLTSDTGQVVVELPELDWQAGSQGLGRAVGLLKNFSYGSPHAGAGRIVLETGGIASVQKAFIIPPSATANYRLVVDLVPGQPGVARLPLSPYPVLHPVPAPVPAPVAAPVVAVPVVEPPMPKPIPAVVTGGNPILSPNAASSVKEGGSLIHPQGTQVAGGPMPALPPPPMPAATPVSLPLQRATTLSDLPVGKPGERSKQAHFGKPIVVIDPGHGGVDPGATSVSGVYEKSIVLALARDVKAQLDKSGKVKCVLTRDSDVFIQLRERVAIGRAANADLFMSLHADTVANDGIRGLSVYTLSQNASDAEAQALADKENKADIVAGIDFSNESPEVTNILIDLVQRESMNLSAGFAAQVIKEVQRETHNVLEANTHRFAGFAVLKAPDVPSVLVEAGYLSNEEDEQMLRRPEYRAKLATALAKAIEHYFAQTPKGRR